MAQLYFNYGAMGSSKSANALMVRFNYEDRGQKCLMVKPRIDTREGTNIIKSRIGLNHSCIYFDELIKIDFESLREFNCIIVDEAQFLSRNEVDYLSNIVDNLNIPVMCYGLRADFKGELFEGSKRLFELADKLTEVKTVCWCGHKAIMNARFNEKGEVLKEGEQIVIGANDKYIALCRKHWKEGNLGEIEHENEEN